MFAAPAGLPDDSSCAGGEEKHGPPRVYAKRQKAESQEERQKEQKEKEDEDQDREPIFMRLGRPPPPSLPLSIFTTIKYKKVPYFSAKWSPQSGLAEDPCIAMIARAVQALFGIHVHPFPVEFVNAFESVAEGLIASSLPLWVLCFHIMDHVVHKKEMPLAFQVELKDEYIPAPFLGLVQKFVAQPDQFGLFLSHFLHHLLAEWMVVVVGSAKVATATVDFTKLISLMQSVLNCSLIRWTLFYGRTVDKDVASFNDSKLFCHCLDHLGIDNNTNSGGGEVRKCSALYGFGGDQRTNFQYCLLLHPAIMGSLSGPLCESPSIQTFLQEDPSSIYWLTIGKQISATLYFDLYQLPRRRAKHYNHACIIRTPNKCFWWLLLPVSDTPVVNPVYFPWLKPDLLFPGIFGFGPEKHKKASKLFYFFFIIIIFTFHLVCASSEEAENFLFLGSLL
jgi:hypothetical protein